MPQPERIRVMVVDDHAMIREGLAFFLDAFEELELVGQASSGDEALAKIGAVRPHVVLLDVNMPDTNGISVLREIRAKYPAIRVIILTNFKEDDVIKAAFENGASAFLMKNVSVTELVRAIHDAHKQ
jgi:NarL family two-component system response regulator LiaR